MDITTIFSKLYEMTAFSNIAAEPTFLIMYALGLLFLYLGIAKHYEPLLLIPIAMGILLANFPGGEMGVFGAADWTDPTTGIIYHNAITLADGTIWRNPATGLPYDIYECGLPQIAHELGLMNMIYYWLIKTGFIPPVIFMGVGAMTDFGPMLRNLKLAIFGAAAQLGIFVTFIVTQTDLMGFNPQEAASIGIIGGADGPTAIFLTTKLAPHLLGPIAVAAYSYMALVPVIQPPIMRALTTKKERMIRMKQLRNVTKKEKIIFPIVVAIIVSLILPSAATLIGCLMLGNLMKESGVVERLSKCVQNELNNIVVIFLGTTVGATATAEAFLNWQTLSILCVGIVAFGFGTAGGVLLAKFMNLFLKEKINPLIGSAGVSAVPMAARVSQTVGQESDKRNFLLMHAMGPNVAGVIGSAVAAGILLSFLG